MLLSFMIHKTFLIQKYEKPAKGRGNGHQINIDQTDNDYICGGDEN